MQQHPNRYTVQRVGEHYRFTFLCDRSGTVHTVETLYPVHPGGDALAEAWEDARRYFNRCHRCGAWVCDEAYSPDEMLCAVCAQSNGALPPDLNIK